MKTREERKLCRGRYLRGGLIFGLLLFLCFQKQMIGGIKIGGLKG